METQMGREEEAVDLLSQTAWKNIVYLKGKWMEFSSMYIELSLKFSRLVKRNAHAV